MRGAQDQIQRRLVETIHVLRRGELAHCGEPSANGLRGKNAEVVAALYAPDNVMFVLAPPLQYRRKNTLGKTGLEEWFATFEDPLGYEIRDLKIASEKEIGFSHCLRHMTGTKDQRRKSRLVVLRDALLPADRWHVEGRPRARIRAVLYGWQRKAIDLRP